MMKKRLNYLEGKIEKLYEAKFKAENKGNYKLSKQINIELISLVKEASELEFKIEFQ